MSNVKVTKMSVAKELFVQIQNGEIAVEAGQSARSVFMQKLLTMVDTTAASANMYFQNIHNAFVKGESLYKYNTQPKTAKVKVEEFKVTKRWYVIDVNGKPTADFDTRTQAQNAAKETNGKWRDLEKHSIA